jgi:hypothetical protein
MLVHLLGKGTADARIGADIRVLDRRLVRRACWTLPVAMPTVAGKVS